MAVIISEFYEKEIENGSLEKTTDGIILYSNTENKLKEILENFVENKNLLAEMKNNKEIVEERITVQRKLNETIFDEDYIDEKLKEISINYVDKFGGLNQSKM